MTASSIAFRADEPSDGGSYAIGSDHQFSRHLALPLVNILEADAADAAVVRADEVDKVCFERELGTGALRRVDKQPVNDGAPRRVEAINIVLRFDRHLDDLVAIVKRRRSDRGRACRLDSV